DAARLRVAVSEDLVHLDLVGEHLVHEIDAGDVHQAQGRVDAVAQGDGARTPGALDDPAAHPDGVPAGMRELTATPGADPAAHDHSSGLDRVRGRQPDDVRNDDQKQQRTAFRV